jgi:hypothetical protein
MTRFIDRLATTARQWAAASAALVLALGAAPLAAHATTPQYFVSYDVTSRYAVSDIFVWNSGALHGGGSYSSLTYKFSTDPGTSTINDPFPHQDPIARTFMFGITGSIGDEIGGQHLVLFTNDAWAADAAGSAFATLFPNTTESDLIADILAADSDAVHRLFTFGEGDAATTPHYGDIAFATGDDFTAIAFSTGQIIGGGTSLLTRAPPSGTPEPATWAMMIIGLAAVGACARRRRTAFAA